jgi:hypothetical protein
MGSLCGKLGKKAREYAGGMVAAIFWVVRMRQREVLGFFSEVGEEEKT